MTTPGFDQLVSALVATGTERPNAERLARRKLGIAEPAHISTLVLENGAVWRFPICLTLPWSLLVSDNAKHKNVPGAPGILTQEYREAKRKIQELALHAAAGATPLAMPLELHACVWLPRENAGDIANRAKLVHDALEHTIYENDRWLHRVIWERLPGPAGVDVDQPRAEITITPISDGR